MDRLVQVAQPLEFFICVLQLRLIVGRFGGNQAWKATLETVHFAGYIPKNPVPGFAHGGSNSAVRKNQAEYNNPHIYPCEHHEESD